MIYKFQFNIFSSLLFALINPSITNAQCDFPFISGEVIMDAKTGNIYIFEKSVSGKVVFRFNTIDPAKYPETQFVQPCSSVNFIKPFFEEGDFIHTWEGEIYPVIANGKKITSDAKWVSILREPQGKVYTEIISLNWKWVKKIEKNNEYQARLKAYKINQVVYWKNGNGEILNGEVKYIYGIRNSLKVKRYTVDNKFLEEEIGIENIVEKPDISGMSYKDTIDMIRKLWYCNKTLVLDLEKKRKYLEENDLKYLELDEEYHLFRESGYDDWTVEQKEKAGYSYDFNCSCTFSDKGEVVCFLNGYKGRTSTYDRQMYGEWKVEGQNLIIENGREKLTFKIEELNNKEWEHLNLTLIKYEYKL